MTIFFHEPHTPKNQLKSVTRGQDTASFTFDAAGNLASEAYPNGVATSYGYDGSGRLTVKETVRDSQTIQQYTQSFDPAGNLVQLTQAGLGTSTYAYDALNRLTSEDIAGYGVISYGYDKTGNRTYYSDPDASNFYYFNAANQPVYEWRDNEAEVNYFTYDDAGNLTARLNESAQPLKSFSYDGLGRLAQAETPGQSPASYAYDALGRRITRTQGAGERNFHFFGASDLSDYETRDGALSTSLLRGPDGLFLYNAYAGNETYYGYQHHSPHGDTTLITDETGASVYSARYDAFGNSLTAGSLGFGYTGKWQRYYDSAAGTIRMGVRDYDPGLGRFTGADPLKGDPRNPQSRNRYPYALNSPLVMYDLDGRIAVAAPVIVGGALLAVAVLSGNEEWRESVEASGAAIGDAFRRGAKGTASDFRSGFEWVGSQAKNKCGSWFGGGADRTLDSQLPPLTLDDILAGRLSIYYSSDKPNTQFGKSIHDLETSLRNNDGKWISLSRNVEPAISSTKRLKGGISEDEVFVNTETGEKILRHRVYGPKGDVHETHKPA